ncbi:MAG: hypothetical protein IJR49_01020, partial [Treponema sp.]|nr:hypothetical protein [Treponema sp.]
NQFFSGDCERDCRGGLPAGKPFQWNGAKAKPRKARPFALLPTGRWSEGARPNSYAALNAHESTHILQDSRALDKD